MIIIKLGKERYLLCIDFKELKQLFGTPKRIFKKKTCIGRFCNVNMVGPIYIFYGKNKRPITCIKNGEISCSQKVTIKELKNILEKKDYI